MIDRDEARRIATTNIAYVADDPENLLLLEEYEDGYVARRKPDDELDESGRLSRRVGQGRIVTDEADGTVYSRAYTGPETIVFWGEDRVAGKI